MKIAAIALRRFSRDGQKFARDERISLEEGLFAELARVGLVGRAPAPARKRTKKIAVSAMPPPAGAPETGVTP